jgi:predicted amidohydrolase
MMREVTIATVCLRAECDVEANRQTFLRYLRAAKAQGAELVLFPEAALQQNPGWGYLSHVPTDDEKAYVARTAEPIPGPSCDWLQAHAKDLGLHLIFGMTERGQGEETGKLYNASVFLGPEGVLGRYRKHRLWDEETGGNEHCFWSYGEQAGLVVDSPFGKIGMMICVEMSHGYGKRLAEAGAQLIATVSAWTGDHGWLFEEYAAQNAIESGCWHVIANQGGTVGQTWDYGHSRIVAPDGTLIASTGKDEGMVVARILPFSL